MLSSIKWLALSLGMGLVGLYYARSAYLEQATVAAQAAATAAPITDTAALVQAKATSTGISLAEEAGFAPNEVALMKRIHARFATGDFVAALQLGDDNGVLDAASPAFHAWLIAQMPVLLTSAAWSLLKVGDCDRATTYLRRSQALGRSLEAAKGLAICYYKQKNFANAGEEFAWYLERNPDDGEMHLVYADVLESDGRYDEAVTELEKAAQAPADQIDPNAIKARLASMKARARENVYQQVETSKNFRLLYHSGDHEDLVSYVLQTLEDALDDYISTYGFKPPPAPIEVVLYRDGDFSSLVVGGPQWAEGLFDGRLRIPVRTETLASKDYHVLREVLRHELVHALFSLASDGRQLPPWFDEGMAQRLACAHPGCGSFVFPPKPGLFLTDKDFLTPYTSFDAIRAGRAYRQSLYLIYTIERLAGDQALQQLISGIGVASDLSSDGVLKPVNMSFASLRAGAAAWWDKGSDLGQTSR